MVSVVSQITAVVVEWPTICLIGVHELVKILLAQTMQVVAELLQVLLPLLEK